jgi:hypothetical protein
VPGLVLRLKVWLVRYRYFRGPPPYQPELIDELSAARRSPPKDEPYRHAFLGHRGCITSDGRVAISYHPVSERGIIIYSSHRWFACISSSRATTDSRFLSKTAGCV